MDITSLPVTPVLRPIPATNNASHHKVSTEAVEPVEQLNQRAGAHERPYGRVLQGELLPRERAPYQSTRAFINERSLDQARPAGQAPEIPNRSRSAIARYLNHTHAEPVSEMTQGRSLNLFV
jgi:hypothetical protein